MFKVLPRSSPRPPAHPSDLWLSAGESIYFVQQQLGHADIQTTHRPVRPPRQAGASRSCRQDGCVVARGRCGLALGTAARTKATARTRSSLLDSAPEAAVGDVATTL